MKEELKMEMRKRAQFTRGLLNLLKDDVDCICIDVATYDLFTINDSIAEAKDTVNKILTNLTELERIVRISKR